MGCSSLNKDYKGIPTILVSFVEVAICIFSIAATWKHFNSAGKRLSNIAVFHLTHSAFCVVYATFNVILYFSHMKICTCDPFMILSCFYVLSFLYMWVIFLRYWDMATTHKVQRESSRHRRAEVRVAVYSSIGAAYFGSVVYFTIYEPSCESNSFEQARSIIICLEIVCLTLESAKIGLACMIRFHHHYFDYQREHMMLDDASDDSSVGSGHVSLNDPLVVNEDTVLPAPSFAQLSEHQLSTTSRQSRLSTRDLVFKHLYRELIQTMAFVSLPLSLIVGFIMRANIVDDKFDESTYPIYLYLFPSIVMLCIMWQRHYITISGKTPEELEFDWMSDSEHESSIHRTSIIRPSSLYVVPVSTPSRAPLLEQLPRSSDRSKGTGNISHDSHRGLVPYHSRNRHDHYSRENNNTFLEGFDVKSKVGEEMRTGLIQVQPLHSSFNFINSKDRNAKSESNHNGDIDSYSEDAFNNMFMPVTPVKGVGAFNPAESLLPPSSPINQRKNTSSSMDSGNVETTSSAFFAYSSSIKVIEDLRPPYMFLNLSYHFMSSIVLPSLEKALSVHNKRLKELLEVTSLNSSLNTSAGSDHTSRVGRANGNSPPNASGLRMTRSSSLYSNLEIDRQHFDLKKKCDDLKQKFVDFVLELRDIVNTMPLPQQHHYYANMFEDIGYMKQSANKKVSSLAYFATNLQVHKTRLFYQVNDDNSDVLNSEEQDTLKNVKDTLSKSKPAEELEDHLGSQSVFNANNVHEAVITAVTFGAPAAHSLGFKNGGLRETMDKITQYSLPPEARTARLGNTPDITVNPDTLLKQLELRYECRAREAIVTSQALNAVSCAAIELLSRIIYKKQEEDKAKLLQYHKAGLLVHCISLLSTSGNELAMLDDFAGALDRLDITLKFHPPDTATFHGGDTFKKKKFTSSINSIRTPSMPFRGGSSVDGLRSGSGGGSSGGGHSSSVNSQEHSIDGDGHQAGAVRKTDPLNLMSVIKMKPTKILKSSSATSDSKNNASSGGDTSHALPSVAASPLDSVFGSPVESVLDSTNTDSKIGDQETSTQQQDRSTTTSDKKKTSRSSKGVMLGRVTIDIQINSMSSYEWLCSTLDIAIKKHVKKKGEGEKGSSHVILAPTIKIVPVLFNLGVNEMQSIANVVGNTSMQTDINRKGLVRMQEYLKKCELAQAALNAATSNQETIHANTKKAAAADDDDDENNEEGTQRISFFADNAKLPLLLNSIEFLVEAVAKEKGKMVDLLLVSSFAARLLNGARTTSCKSAKDRTSVFHTLEVARLAERMGWLERSKEMEFLDELRGKDGVRLQNCTINIGKPMYSFNSVQTKALPRELRPPAYTCASGET